MKTLLVLLSWLYVTQAHADTLDSDIDEGKPITTEALAALSERYAREPSVHDVVKAALQAQHADPAHYEDLASRSRLRGLIPHLDVGLRRGQGIDLRWTVSDDLTGNRTTADDLMLFATLRFDLDRLMFSSEEVSIARESRAAHEARHELIRKVVHLYFLRRRLLLERDLLGGTSIARELRIEESEAVLDAFTDGAFRRMLNATRTAWKTAASTNASEQR